MVKNVQLRYISLAQSSRTMDEDVTDILKVVIAVIITFALLFGGLFLYSGMSRPLTVVESGSMQHSEDRSMIGVIDTGDIIVMVDPDRRSITSYVEGYHSGYSSFGEYGDVIIYYRDNKNPVIHRAILWLDWNAETETWSAPSLQYFDESRWYDDNGSEKDYNDLKGTLTITGLGWKGYTASIDLDRLDKHSGYLTSGDNNYYFDQEVGISTSGLIEKDNIKAIAGFEIPWFGCIKLYLNDKNVDKIPSNSLPCLIVAVIDIIFLLLTLMVVVNYYYMWKDERKNKE